MSKNMAYELVEAADAETLSSLVTKKLVQGWKLVGSACANDSEGVVHRGWMDFGGVFESIFWRIRRFILVVWAKKWPKNGPNNTRKAPQILCTTPPWALYQAVALTAKAGKRIRKNSED